MPTEKDQPSNSATAHEAAQQVSGVPGGTAVGGTAGGGAAGGGTVSGGTVSGGTVGGGTVGGGTVGGGATAEGSTGPLRDVPIDWEALEDAFENNAPEVHSYLHLGTGDVLRVVDGVADPQMHARIASDTSYLRIDPVSSREQYRWMERYIPMVEDPDLQQKLTQAIDGKGAFRRFKDVLMNHGPERERWFSFRSERLRIFMEAWLSAHALAPVARPAWTPDVVVPVREGEVAMPPRDEPKEPRRGRSAESLRKVVREIADALGPRDLDTLVAFAEFLKARRAARSFTHQAEGGPGSPDGNASPDGGAPPEGDASQDGGASADGTSSDDEGPASQERAGHDRASQERVSGTAERPGLAGDLPRPATSS